MLKRPPPKKLQLSTLTIRFLSEAEQKQVAGGLSAACEPRTQSKWPGCP